MLTRGDGKENSLIAGGTRLGPYEILAPIGAGGMGEVYKARDTRLDRFVAVKVISENRAGDSSARMRFEQEAKAIAALSHPNILSIHDFRQEEGVTYAVMELLEGETLQMRLSQGPLPMSKAAEIAGQIAQGLAAAHQRGIVHRDLKPGNIFLTKTGMAKILDFGLAKLGAPSAVPDGGPARTSTAEMETRSGTVLGTLGYMSPEQARGLPADARSDIFAFGIVFYEMLAGKRAFAGNTASDVLAAILTKDPDPLPAVTPPGFDRIVKRCLEKRPEDRFSSAHDLAFALEAVTGWAPGGAASPVKSSAMRPRAKPRRVPALAIAVALASVGAGFWLWKGQSSKPGASSPGQTVKAIAIFPLDDLSGDRSQTFFAPGMTDALNTKLTQIRSLKVIGQASAEKCKQEKMPLPKVAQVLGVDAVVQGSILRVGDSVRISVRLLDARTDANLWAESYERKMSDVLVLQGEVAQAIAVSVRAAVTPEERKKLAGKAVDPRAYEEYLAGRYDFFHLGGGELYDESISHFKRAVELDAGFAPAHFWLSRSYLAQCFNGHAPCDVVYPLAKQAAYKAVAVAPAEGISHAALATVLYYDDPQDLAGTERELRKAMELDAQDPMVLHCYAGFLTGLGRFEEALSLRRKAVEIDPINPLTIYSLGLVYASMGRWAEASRAIEQSLDLGWGLSRTFLYSELGVYYALQGDKEKAAAYEKKVKADPAWEKLHGCVFNLAVSSAAVGKSVEAREMLRRLKAFSYRGRELDLDLSVVYAWLGEERLAFQHMEKAVPIPAGNSDIPSDLPRFPPEFRKDPRFPGLLRKSGLSMIEIQSPIPE